MRKVRYKSSAWETFKKKEDFLLKRIDEDEKSATNVRNHMSVDYWQEANETGRVWTF